MFGWLSKRRVRAQAKLVYQNQSALELLSGWAEGKGDLELEQLIEALKFKHAERAVKLPASMPADVQMLQELVNINSEVRRMFDATAMRHVHSLDKATEPSMGWSAYLDMQQEMAADER